MTIFLRTSRDPQTAAWLKQWVQITERSPALPDDRRMPGIGKLLEHAFDAIRDEWWSLARNITADRSGELSVAGSCAPYASDLGLMLAWRRVVADLTAGKTDVLVVCDDPWLFRALGLVDGLVSGRAPGFRWRQAGLAVRGMLARARVAIRVVHAALRFRRRSRVNLGGAYLLVYGHPSTTTEADAYFGDLLQQLPKLRRIFHTDDFRVAAKFGGDDRSESLHAFGSPIYGLFALPFARWRSDRRDLTDSIGWLLRRAITLEAGGGSAAMTRWQIHCQNRFLRARKPRSIAWPWEHHPWERVLVRAARNNDTATIGYQHTDAGPHQFNMSPHASAGGVDNLPDGLVLNGPAYRSQFVAWGVPAERMTIGGAFRLPVAVQRRYDPAGPVFVALSSIAEISREMLRAVAMAQRPGRQFLIKAHPMYPFNFAENDVVRRTDIPFARGGNVSALFYGTGSSGIEGLLAGVPTFRLLPSRRPGLETMPDGMRARTVTCESLDNELNDPRDPPNIDVRDYFSEIDLKMWRMHLVSPAEDGQNLQL